MVWLPSCRPLGVVGSGGSGCLRFRGSIGVRSCALREPGMQTGWTKGKGGLTGDSRGDVRFWRVVGTGCDARLQQIAVWGGVHAGGVNAAAACVMGDGVVVVTGGDDEAVRATWVRRKAQEGEGDEERVSVGIGRHTAAVTGVAVTGVAGGVVVVSVGADQRVCWVGLSVVDGAIVMGAGMVLGCDVADPAAVCIDRVVEVGDEVTKVAVVVVGCGMQRLVGHV